MIKNKRIASIVILRGIAVLAVCTVHIGLSVNLHINYIIDFIIKSGQNGVAIFFVISGFILPYSLHKKSYEFRDFFTFLLKRSIRIDPPYWFVITLLFISGFTPLTSLNFKSIIFHLFYLIPFIKNATWFTDVFWTLSVEFQFYILLGFCYPILKKINVNTAILSLVVISAACIFTQFTYRGIIISNLYDFAIGYIVFFGYINSIRRVKTVVLVLLFSIFVMLSVSFTCGFIPLVTALFIIFYKGNYLPKYLSFPGQISYSLYLIHLPACILFLKIISQPIHSPLLLFFLCLIASILAAAIIHLFIELPSIRLSHSFKLKPKEQHLRQLPHEPDKPLL